MERRFERRHHVRRRADRKRARSDRGRKAAPDSIADTAPQGDLERAANERGDDDGMAAAQPDARAPRPVEAE